MHSKDLRSSFRERQLHPISIPTIFCTEWGFASSKLQDTLSSPTALSTGLLPSLSLLLVQEPEPCPHTPGTVSAGAWGSRRGCGAILGDGCIPQAAAVGGPGSREAAPGRSGPREAVSLASCSEAAEAYLIPSPFG